MRIATVLPFLFILTAHAQITLQNPEHVASPGQSFAVNAGPFVTPGPGGANQVWDFSSMGATGTGTMSFVDPASTPSGADFTASTVALFDGDQTYAYFQATGSEYLVTGNDDGNISFPLTDPSKFWPFPCAYQDTWTDILGGSIVVQGQTVTRAGSVSGIADGYGTLVLPFGTVDDVLRVVVDEDYQDALILGTVIHDIQTHYFFKRFLPFPVMQITNVSTNVNGSVTTSQTTQWVDSAAVGVLESVFNSNDVQLYPNPATERIEILSATALQGTATIVDALGRMVGQVPLAPSGTDRLSFRVDDLAPGRYALRLIGQQGSVVVLPFCVH
ncbi:MAG: T9SS type A sorting domain-containing protein [Flavobacteriales bacterium]